MSYSVGRVIPQRDCFLSFPLRIDLHNLFRQLSTRHHIAYESESNQ